MLIEAVRNIIEMSNLAVRHNMRALCRNRFVITVERLTSLISDSNKGKNREITKKNRKFHMQFPFAFYRFMKWRWQRKSRQKEISHNSFAIRMIQKKIPKNVFVQFCIVLLRA
jgi:hypothetical protein